MKRLDTLLLPLAAMLAILSCSKKQETTLENVPEGPRIVLNTAAKWNQFNLPAYIGDLSAYPADLQTVIDEFFPRRCAMEDAKVLFVGTGEMAANLSCSRAAWMPPRQVSPRSLPPLRRRALIPRCSIATATGGRALHIRSGQSRKSKSPRT